MNESNSTKHDLIKQYAHWTAPATLRYMSRTVRRRPDTGRIGEWFARLFILPHMIVGVFSICVLIAYTMWAAFGSDIPARIVSVATGTGTSKGGNYTTYEVVYDCKENDLPAEKKERVSKEYFEELNQRKATSADHSYGTGVARRIKFGEWNYRSLLDPHSSIWLPLLAILGWTTFWNGVLSIFVWQIYVKPMRIKRLYRYGTPAPGTITAMDIVAGKGRRYVLEYMYLLSPGNLVSGKMDCAKSLYASARVDEVVTVLHYPGAEKPSVIYKYGNYTCETNDS